MSSAVLPPTYVEGFHIEENVRRMKYSRLGNTDMVVSSVSLGGCGIGGIYGDSGCAIEMVKEALKNGINFIDTAYWYGQGKSETQIGKALKEAPRGSYYIATKVGRYEKDWTRMFDFSAERVMKSVDESLERLGLDCVDLIQVHDLEFAMNDDLILNETLPALEKVKNAGKCRYIGITGYELSKLLKIVQQSRVRIDTVLSYCRGTMQNNEIVDYAPQFKEHGVGIINGSIMAMGMLSVQGPQRWIYTTVPSDVLDACAKAAQYAKSNEMDISRLALDYSLGLAGIDTCCFGAHSVENVRDNLNVSLNGLSPREKHLQKELIESYFKPLGNRHWEGSEKKNYLDGLAAAGK